MVRLRLFVQASHSAGAHSCARPYIDRRPRLWVLATLVALLPHVAQAFPVYSAANGSVALKSAFGGDVSLDAGSGKVAVRSLLSAESGVAFNATTLNEAVLSSLATLVQAQTTLMTTQNDMLAKQSANLETINSVFTTQTNALTLQNMAANLTAELARQQEMISSQQVAVQNATDLLISTASSILATVITALEEQAANVSAALVAQQTAVNAVIASDTALVNSTAALQTQLLAPPVCTLPGGVGLLFTGTAWMCNCAAGWSGGSCDVPPSPPPPSPPPPSPNPPSPPPPPSSYPFRWAAITPGGTAGTAGPALSAILSGMSGSPDPSTWSSQLSVVNGVVRWPVPTSGVYSITVAGATGGSANSSASLSASGGGGRIMAAQFQLGINTMLQILVGQVGGKLQFVANGGGGTQAVGGGGGGTFVVDANGNPLIVAGGGGGAISVVNTAGEHNNGVRPKGQWAGNDAPPPGQTSGTYPVAIPGRGSCQTTSPLPGTAGGGGTRTYGDWGSAGAGFNGDGQGSAGGGSSGGLSFSHGGAGGITGLACGTQVSLTQGGFGGGGGGTGHCDFEADGGGGGGYSGGASSFGCEGPGGSGGNYVAFSALSAVVDLGLNYAGDGWVNISFVHF